MQVAFLPFDWLFAPEVTFCCHFRSWCFLYVVDVQHLVKNACSRSDSKLSLRERDVAFRDLCDSSQAQRKRSEPLGRARTADFERLAGVFASRVAFSYSVRWSDGWVQSLVCVKSFRSVERRFRGSEFLMISRHRRWRIRQPAPQDKVGERSLRARQPCLCRGVKLSMYVICLIF